MSLASIERSRLNRSDLHIRLGLAQVVTMMGGTGRAFGGGYAEYDCVATTQVLAFHSDRDRDAIGAVPERLKMSYGSLTGAWAHNLVSPCSLVQNSATLSGRATAGDRKSRRGAYCRTDRLCGLGRGRRSRMSIAVWH